MVQERRKIENEVSDMELKENLPDSASIRLILELRCTWQNFNHHHGGSSGTPTSSISTGQVCHLSYPRVMLYQGTTCAKSFLPDELLI